MGDSAGPPAYIYWYKGSQVINYSSLKHIQISYSRSTDTSPVSTLVIKVGHQPFMFLLPTHN